MVRRIWKNSCWTLLRTIFEKISVFHIFCSRTNARWTWTQRFWNERGQTLTQKGGSRSNKYGYCVIATLYISAETLDWKSHIMHLPQITPAKPQQKTAPLAIHHCLTFREIARIWYGKFDSWLRENFRIFAFSMMCDAILQWHLWEALSER